MGPTKLFTEPDYPFTNVITYNAHAHPELTANGELLISYNVNSLQSGDDYADVRIYRPRFIDVTWPILILAAWNLADSMFNRRGRVRQ